MPNLVNLLIFRFIGDSCTDISEAVEDCCKDATENTEDEEQILLGEVDSSTYSSEVAEDSGE